MRCNGCEFIHAGSDTPVFWPVLTRPLQHLGVLLLQCDFPSAWLCRTPLLGIRRLPPSEARLAPEAA
jgi:hypothetical protein